MWMAVWFAPLGAPLAVGIIFAVEAAWYSGLTQLTGLIFYMPVFYMLGLPLAYVAMVLTGVPYLAWLHSRDQLDWAHVCVGSSILGILLWAGFSPMVLSNPTHIAAIPFGGFPGLIVGVLFSWIAKLPRRVSKKVPLK